MILDKHKDKGGTFYKLGMIERSALTLDNYASSKFGSRFYSDEFLKGFCNQRNKIYAKMTKISASLILVTTVLAFFDNIQGTTKVFGIVFSIPPIGAAALCVLVAMTMVAWVMVALDQLIIDRYMYILGSRIGIYNFELIVLNYSSENLWTSVMGPKYFGLQSEKGHKAAQALISIFFLLVGAALFVYPISVIFFTSSEILTNNPSNVAKVLIALSYIAVLFSIIFVLVFSFNYKFRPSGLPEPSDAYIPDDYFDLGGPFVEENKSDKDQG